MYGTKGQVYLLLDPVVLQSVLVQNLPVLLPEPEVRIRLAEMFDAPASSPDSSLPGDVMATPNEDPEKSVYIAYGHLMHNGGAYIVPVKWLDGNGVDIAVMDIYGNADPENSSFTSTPMNIVLEKSNLDGNWYVSGTYLPEYFPTDQP